MLRRGYSYANSDADKGLLFVSFQRELRTFVQTQRRLDEGDALMAFATATASGTFLVLPGFSAERPLGADLFG
jgi:deferrochelatase/peroxidase EfeB